MTVTGRRAMELLALVLGLSGVPRSTWGQGAHFDHAAHAKLFPSCTTCHQGVVTVGASVWPAPATCAACHDGTVRPSVVWVPPSPGRYNLRFEHATHAAALVAAGRTPPSCVACHAPEGAPWMQVGPPVAERCLGCHGIRTAHLEAPDSACATCHLSLAEARTLTPADIATFPAPPDHAVTGFSGPGGHGALAQRQKPIAASCATCHARDFCLECHVDALERATIEALAVDPRAAAIVVHLTAPQTHAGADFLTTHGRLAGRDVAQCASCHTRESCLTCHVGQPQVASRLPAAGTGRGDGAMLVRHPPASHQEGFLVAHPAAARASQATCAGCHIRADCLECHRPAAGRASGYHPAGFLVSHPAAAYSRQTNCSECHNTGSFCASCHARAGLTAQRVLQPGYHDSNQFFLLGHGGAARQNLESCVSCHTERDCLTCHAATAVGGRGFNPHGPGFNAAQMLKANPQMCTACHGENIPMP